MSTLLFVHHSQTGATLQLVAAARAGAATVAAVTVVTRSAAVARAEEVLAADALVFATPENFGYMAGALKSFFDRTFYACMADSTPLGGGVESRLAGRAYTVMVAAGSDGSGAMQSVDRIATGWRLRKVHPGLIARREGGAAGSAQGHLTDADLTSAHALGALLAEALAMGVI